MALAPRVCIAAALAGASACASFEAGSVPVPVDVTGDAGVSLAPTADGSAPADACGKDCPVASWSFDEPGGAALVDGTGHGNDGLIGTATRVAGKHGSALGFSTKATSIQAVAPNRASLDIQGPCTLALWAWLDAGQLTTMLDQVLIGKPWTEANVDVPYYQFGLEWHTNTQTLAFYVGGPTHDYVQLDIPAPISRWAHVAVVVDGTRVTGYVDGTSAASTATPVMLTARGTAVRFGGDAVGGQYFGGKLDEVRVYARALTSTEIFALATTP